jgi:hypothetical protein
MTTHINYFQIATLFVLLLLFLASMLVVTFSAFFFENREGGIQEMTSAEDLKDEIIIMADSKLAADDPIPTMKTLKTLHDIPPFTPDSKILWYHLHQKDQGFGSLTINAMFYGLFFKQAYNRTLVIDESSLMLYTWNKTTHIMYKGYFEAQFPIVSDSDDNNNDNYIDNDNNDQQLSWIPTAPSTCENLTVWKNGDADCQVLNAMLYGERSNILEAGRTYFKDALYDLVAEYTCRQLPRLRPKAQEMVDELFLTASPTRTFSVAFHVRRTDKIREDRYYAAEEYVETFLKANPDGAKDAQHCFIATDDYLVVDKMQVALTQYNISCQLSTLTTIERTASRRKRDDFLRFLAQLEMLIQVSRPESDIGCIYCERKNTMTSARSTWP